MTGSLATDYPRETGSPSMDQVRIRASEDKPPALEITSLVKRFGENVAVDNLNLIVPSGSFLGYRPKCADGILG